MDNDSLDIIDLISAVQACALGKTLGMLVSTSHAVEELRVLSGDFVTPDEELANAVSEIALTLGCSIVFDEQAGADVLRLA
jgi:hypothetical protein